MRFKLSRWLNAEDTNDGESRVLYSLPSESENVQVELEEDTELETAAELVDTTLFRAYMLCRPQLVGPLVRRPNRCVPSVVQEMLEQAHVLSLISLLTSRNIVILLNSCLGKDYIDRHCSYCSHWDRKKNLRLIPSQSARRRVQRV